MIKNIGLQDIIDASIRQINGLENRIAELAQKDIPEDDFWEVEKHFSDIKCLVDKIEFHTDVIIAILGKSSDR